MRHWRESSVHAATYHCRWYLRAGAFPPPEVFGLQFSVLLAVAVRLATLREFIEHWEALEMDQYDLPLAWLRFQMGGGPALFKSVGHAVKRAMMTQGVPEVSALLEVVSDLWGDIATVLGLPLDSKCPVVIDEAQILTQTVYARVEDKAVRRGDSVAVTT